MNKAERNKRNRKIIKLRYDKGLSQKKIAEKIGCSRFVVSTVLSRTEGYVKGERVAYQKGYDREEIIKLRDSGKTQQEIADAVGCSRATVASVLKSTEGYVKGQRVNRKAYSRNKVYTEK